MIIMRYSLVGFVFILLAGMIAAAAADVQTGVVLWNGKPLPGAALSIKCGSDAIETSTDESGHFEVGGIPSAPCKYAVSLFGFATEEKEAAVSSDSLVFDLKLQKHSGTSAATEATAAPNGPPLPGGPGRGGFPGMPSPPNGVPPGPASGTPGRPGPAAQGPAGFQSLSLVQNGTGGTGNDNAALFQQLAGAGASSDQLGGASQAFMVNGTLSNGVLSQSGDAASIGATMGAIFGGPPGTQNSGSAAQGGAGTQASGFGGPGGPGGGGGFGPPGGGGPGGPGGGPGGPGGPPPGMGGRGGGPNGRTVFGNGAAKAFELPWIVTFNYNFGNSALNARPYSLATSFAGQTPAKAATANNGFGATVGGATRIPKTKLRIPNGFWILNYNGQRNRTGSDLISTVPTAAERTGDFSAVTQSIYSSGNIPFAGNVIPQSLISAQARGLLAYIPAATGQGTTNNFEMIRSNPNNSDTLSVLYSQPLTKKDRITMNLSHQSRQSSTVQSFGYIDPTTGSGGSLSLGYSRTLSSTTTNNLSLSLNRNVTNNLSYFSNGANVAGALGISGVLATPATYGPPTINFANFTTLTDGTPSANHATTYGLTDSLSHTHGKHSLGFGYTISRPLSNQLMANNARGTFTFTGVNTQQVGSNGLPVQGTGYDLADFLLGQPYQASVANYLNGNDMFYFRQTTMAAYATDDYRLSSRLTLNLGLRWELYQPQTEKYGHLANLDLSADGKNVAVVLPGGTSSYSRGSWPSGLINTDYRLLEPRLGLAWRPFTFRQVVIRAGYGVYYNGSSLRQFGTELAAQPPFVQTVSQTDSETNPLTLANGFTAPASTDILNTYGVSRDYRPARAQQWNFILQNTFKKNYVLQLSYNGTKGTGLDVLEGPNRAAPGDPSTAQSRLPISYATAFTYDSSLGSSIKNSATIQLTRRFATGFGGVASYTLSKAIDDSSTLGAGVVQIEGDLKAERGLSNSDQRHQIQIQTNYQTFATNNRKENWWKIVRNWQFFNTLSVNSGTPFTATVADDSSGTGIVGAARAEATGLSVSGGNGHHFNPAAFAVPATGTYGDAGRNTIPGIWNFSLNSSIMRSFLLGERRVLTFQVSANNPVNHPSITGINTVIGTINSGLPQTAGQMRTVTATLRVNF